MRLLTLGPGHPFRGGIARTTTELVLALRRRGHTVDFLTPKRQYGSLLYPGGKEHDPGACPKVPNARRVLDPLRPWAWPAAHQAARRTDADAWIVPYWTWAWAPFFDWLLARSAVPPVVLVVHNLEDHDAGCHHRVAARRVFRHANAMLTHAQGLARELLARYPERPVSSHLLPPCGAPPLPTCAAARHELGVPADARLAVFLGLIRPYKGVDTLLDAAELLPDGTDWRFVIAGEAWGGLAGTLSRRVQAPHLCDRVTLRPGWAAESEVASLLAAADIVVLPYKSGSQSAVAPQALAAKVPVLSTTVGGLPELIRDDVNGRLIPPDDPSALASTLLELERSDLDRLALGAARTAERLTWNNYASTVERILQNIATTPTAAPSR